MRAIMAKHTVEKRHYFAGFLSEPKNITIAAALIVGCVGSYLLIYSQAATPTASFETESGSRTGAVALASDTTASGGSGVKFGTGGSSGWKTLSTKTGGWAWQWQLTGTVNETVLDSSTNPNKLYDIDMYNATSALISRLHAKNFYVICYVESGDWANSRPDAGDFAISILGKGLDGFPDEKYINITQLDGAAGPTGKTLRQIMTARLQLAQSKGCDGIEPDLDDLWVYTQSELGFSISRAQQVTYNKFLIDTGHSLGMAVGLKNGADPGGTFEQSMVAAGADFALNEECNQYDECSDYSAFINAGRPVFQVEYLDNQGKAYSGTNGTCAKNNTAGFDGIVKDSSSSLAATPRIACRTGN